MTFKPSSREDIIAKILVWSTEPGSTLQALSALAFAYALLAWLFDLASNRSIIGAIAATVALWCLGVYHRKYLRPRRQHSESEATRDDQ
jgi:hypothetical protein